MITVVVGKEIEKIKGDFESYLNGLNMVGEISYSQYSELYDEGTKQIQRAYELGKSELEEENVELKTKKIPELERKIASIRGCHKVDLAKLKARMEQVERLKKENTELKKLKRECETSLCRAEYQYNYEQLARAKEIIKNLMKFAEIDCREYEEAYKEAEQFVKE